ncbi:TPA: hypothetical protein ACQNRU_001662, partial [Streptococcus pyogenes]
KLYKKTNFIYKKIKNIILLIRKRTTKEPKGSFKLSVMISHSNLLVRINQAKILENKKYKANYSKQYARQSNNKWILYSGTN